MSKPCEQRRAGLETIRKILKRERRNVPLNWDTVKFCADRIALVDGESEGVKLIRECVGKDHATAHDMLRRAYAMSKELGETMRGGNRRGVAWNKGGRENPETAEEVLERLSLMAASDSAMLVKLPSGRVEPRLVGSRIGKGVEILGVYDIRADARDMLADIKEAMA
jgi:hypothetical protein